MAAKDLRPHVLNKYVVAETEETITITKTYLYALVLRDIELDCLEAGGVNNWDYYSDALREGGYFNLIGDEDDEDED
jgi:hypothetical protein